MPYRRLPNTDLARLRALIAAMQKGGKTNPTELAFSQKNLLELKSFYPHFDQIVKQYQHSRKHQANVGKQLGEQLRAARMYVSHFFQVVNLSIQRGELKPEIRKYYGINESEKAVPEVTTEQQLIFWGERLLKGEEARMATGATRIYNPSLAMVKVKFEKFLELHNSHKDLLNTSQKLQDKVNDVRTQADKLILEIWNEVETVFNALPPAEKRAKSSEYGLIYVFRPSEKME